MGTAGDMALGAAIGAGIWLTGFMLFRAFRPSHSKEAAPPVKSEPKETRITMDPLIAPAIVRLMRDLDDRWPSRSRASDGTLPSAAHHAANPTSDHETGDALDITRDRVNGPNLYDLTEAFKKDRRAKYLIFDSRITNPLILGGAWRPYEPTAISIDHAKRDDATPWDLSAVRTGEAMS